MSHGWILWEKGREVESVPILLSNHPRCKKDILNYGKAETENIVLMENIQCQFYEAIQRNVEFSFFQT